MPATSSAPGSQPEAVAKKNQKQAVQQAIKPVAKATAKAVSTSTQITEAVSSTASSVSRGTSAPSSTGTSRPRSGRRSRPEPALKPYKPPKPVAVKVRQDLKALPGMKAQKAASNPIRVGPHLTGDEIRVTPNKTVVSPHIARKAVATLPKPVRQQAAQKLKAQKPQQPAPTPHKAPKAQRKAVKAKLKEAAKQSQGGLAAKIGHRYSEHNSASGDWGGKQLTFKQIATLAEAAGMPGITMAQITKGESGGRPGATGIDPGGTKGLGLWMVTTGYNDALIAKYGGEKAMLNPVKNAKAAAEIYRSQGLGAWYGDQYVTDPNAHLPGGQQAAQQKLEGNPTPIPRALKQKAKDVLGNRQAAKVIARAKHPTSAASGPLPGPLSGSKAVVQKLVGAKVHGDHGVKNEGTVHTPGGDHYDPHSYAQDINQPGGNPAEGEPPYNQATLNRIVKNARKFGFSDIPHLTIGQNYEGTAKGYRLQLLTNEGGTVNHIHVGVRYEGATATAGAATTAVSGTAAGVAAGTTPGQSVPAPAAHGQIFATKKSKKRRRGRSRRPAPSISLSSLPAQLNPADYQVKPSTQSYADYVQKAPTTFGL